MAYAVSNDGSGEGIRAQLFDSTGTPVGADFAVNGLTTGDQELPIAVGLVNGGFLISWADSGSHAYAGQFYDAAGHAVGGQVTLAPGGDSVFDIATLASGNLVIVWPAADGELKGQIYTVDGATVGAEFQINTPTPGIDMLPDITALASGGFAVAWTSPTAAGDGDIHAQVFTANGTPAGDEIVVGSSPLGETLPHLVSFGTDDLMVAWLQYDEELNAAMMMRPLYTAVQGTEASDVLAATSGRDFFFGHGGDDQLFGGDASDELHGDSGNDTLDGGNGNDTLDGGAGDDVINTGSSTGTPFDGDLVWGGSGGDHITAGDGWDTIYSDQREDPELGYAIFNINFPEFYHGPTLDRGSEVDVIVAGGGDDFVSIGYGDSADGGSESGGSVGDRLMVSFAAAPSGITADFRNPTLTIGGGTITAFESVLYLEGSQFNDVFTFGSFPGDSHGGTEISTLGGDDQVIAGFYTVNIWGGDGNDLLDAHASQNLQYIDGGNGNDTIIGSSFGGSSWLDGGEGDDTIHGGALGEILRGGAGNDMLDGGNGTDIADYGDSTVGVSVSLAVTGPQDTHDGTDTLVSIENLQGSAFSDTLIGDANANEIHAGAGDDMLIGGGGNDLLDGSDGNDTLDGRGSSATLVGGNGNDTYYVDGGDTINETIGGVPTTGTDQVYSSVTFTLGLFLENLTLTEAGAINGTGNNLNNIIVGNSAANVLSGSGGSDTLEGGAGDDVLHGGFNVDTLTGGAGNDLFSDSKAGLNGDTISDFSVGDKIVLTDATLAGFTYSLSGHTLTYTGGSLTLTNVPGGRIVAAAAAGGGVELTVVREVHNDFNGDGKSDLLWRSDAGYLSDWLGTATGALANNDANAATWAPTSWHVAGTGDFNGDGKIDLLWRADSGHLSNWLGSATGGFANNDANAATWAPTSWHIVGTGDFNGDGKSDILWRADTGHLSDWLGSSSGAFVNNDANAATWAPTSWHIVGTGDFNGDGKVDLLWRADTGHLSDWLGTASGGFVNNDNNAATWAPTNWTVVATGDFNGDHIDDILWRADTGHLSNWLGTATGGFVNNDANAATWAPSTWHIAATGDFNGDGKTDIAWRADTGHLSNWLGSATGGFVNNDANAATWAPTDWHVQDPFVHDSLV
jgi:Ca2+-binding RTX toxin-like protein